MAKRSPPIPFIIGSTTPIIAFVAMAASTALPPLSRIRTPASEASGDSEATMPPLATTIDRACVLSWASDGTAPATRHAVTLVTARNTRFTVATLLVRHRSPARTKPPVRPGQYTGKPSDRKLSISPETVYTGLRPASDPQAQAVLAGVGEPRLHPENPKPIA